MRLNKKKVHTVRLQNLSYGHKQSGTLKVAIELGLFTKVSHGASGISEIAREVGLSQPNAEKACSSLYGPAAPRKRGRQLPKRS
ncbi:MAG: hypothetical protein KAV87_34345 [Desulfobacteraceae bacterium]|nr:hypothetical protein [Desulfobacteraceae bacterium]